jgi:peptidoglycan/xylan/chitin deacetylase (PgdA/CDA1 family)
MYHRIGAALNEWEQKYCISPDNFSAHMQALADNGYKACTANDLIDWLSGDIQLPDKSLLVTFDDGYLGVFEHGLPVLKELEWPAAMFLVSGLIGKKDSWCQRENPSRETYPLMGIEEIRIMRTQGFSFHSHSRSHPDLSQRNETQLTEELRGSREDLEHLLGEPVGCFAYPYGRYNDLVLDAAKKAGYKAAFSVQPGFNRPGVDPYRIRRIDVFGTDTPAMLLRKVSLGTNDGSWQHTLGYYFSRVLAKVGIKSS